TIRVFNKIDLLSQAERDALPAGENVVQVSAVTGAGLDQLLAHVDAALTADPVGTLDVSIPQNEGKLLAMVEGRGKILKREYTGDRVELTVEGPSSLLRQVQSFQTHQQPARFSKVEKSRLWRNIQAEKSRRRR